VSAASIVDAGWTTAIASACALLIPPVCRRAIKPSWRIIAIIVGQRLNCRRADGAFVDSAVGMDSASYLGRAFTLVILSPNRRCNSTLLPMRSLVAAFQRGSGSNQTGRTLPAA